MALFSKDRKCSSRPIKERRSIFNGGLFIKTGYIIKKGRKR